MPEQHTSRPVFVVAEICLRSPRIHQDPSGARIEEGERGDGVPEVKVYSKELVAYMSSFLPVAPYFRSTDERINGVRDSQYIT